MKILGKQTEAITTETYVIELEDGRKVTYIEYLNQNGRVIDAIIRDVDGNSIEGYGDDVPAMLEAIQKFLDDTEGA